MKWWNRWRRKPWKPCPLDVIEFCDNVLIHPREHHTVIMLSELDVAMEDSEPMIWNNPKDEWS
jgi:hypothetical protein